MNLRPMANIHLGPETEGRSLLVEGQEKRAPPMFNAAGWREVAEKQDKRAPPMFNAAGWREVAEHQN